MKREKIEDSPLFAQYGIGELNHFSRVEEEHVHCPVKGCTTRVSRMRSRGPNLNTKKHLLKPHFFCKAHEIYISPSTFEYHDPYRNLLWKSDDDNAAMENLQSVNNGKRTWSRMGRENDEDSLTWNVFRFLQRNSLIPGLIANLTGSACIEKLEKVLYWSVDVEEVEVSRELRASREALGESRDKGSEPDLIVVTDESITIVELKLNAPAITADPKKGIQQGYQNYLRLGGKGLMKNDFKQSVDLIGYELSRFVMLGHAYARILGKKHAKILLIRKGNNVIDLDDRFAHVLAEPQQVSFSSSTWDHVFDYVAGLKCDTSYEDHKLLVSYLRNKSCGYESGKIRSLLRCRELAPLCRQG